MAKDYGKRLRESAMIKQTENFMEQKVFNSGDEEQPVQQQAVAEPIPQTNLQMQTTAQPASVPSPSVMADRVPATEVRNREEQLRNDYLVYLSTFGGSHMKRNNVEIPKGIHDRLTNIKSRLDDGTQGVVKLNLKELIQLAMLEFVEKYDR